VYVIQVCWQFASRIRTEPVPSWSCSQAVSKTVWHIPLLRVQWKTPDDGQRKCPNYVEFYLKKYILEISASSWFYYKNSFRHVSVKLVTLTVRNLNSFVRDKLYIGLLFRYCFSSLWSFFIFFWSHICNAHNLHPCSFSYPPIESTCQVFYFITVSSARTALIEWTQRRSFLSVRPHIPPFELFDSLFLSNFIPCPRDLS